MTKYEQVAYFSPEEAGEFIDLLSNEGMVELIDRLADDGYLDFEPTMSEKEPWGTDDELYHYRDYVVSISPSLGYLAVTRIVENV